MDERVVKQIVDSPPRCVKEAVKTAACGLARATRPRAVFAYRGREYGYCFHTYNLTWRNERSVEVPIALGFLEEHAGAAVLEVGNVLSHYAPVEHDVLDRYEVSPGVINEDAADFAPGRLYDAIVSVSTLEHVGMYEDPPDPAKVVAAVDNLVALLAPGGELLATAPVGLNPEFDRLVAAGAVPFDELSAMRRTGFGNRWQQVPYEEVRGTAYRGWTYRAGAIILGTIRKR